MWSHQSMQIKLNGGETSAFPSKKEVELESLRILRPSMAKMIDSMTTQNEDTCIVQQMVRCHVASM